MNDQNGKIKISYRKTVITDQPKKKKSPFSELVHNQLKTCKNGTHTMKMTDISRAIGINNETVRKMIGGQKPVKKRDFVIAVCMITKMDRDQTDQALRLHQMLELKTNADSYICDETTMEDEDPRDTILVGFLEGDFISVYQVNSVLLQNGFLPLDLINENSTHRQNNRYRIAEKTVTCDLDYDSLLYDPSLEIQYSPRLYDISATCWVEDRNSAERYRLRAFQHREPTIEKFEKGGYEWPPKAFDGTGDFQDCFLDLRHMIDVEVKRVMSTVNDTRNYKTRTSARIIDGVIHVFYETYNYFIPTWNEYFWMEYSMGEYRFSVTNKSLFLWRYLGDDQFNRYVGRSPEPPKDYVTSLTELEGKKKSAHSYSDQTRYGILIGAFKHAKIEIDNMLRKIRSRETFVRNTSVQCPSKLFPLYFYGLLERFDCKYDDPTEVYGTGKQEIKYALLDGTTVTISVDEVLRAYELGFDSIEDIAVAIKKFGKIENILS